MAVILVAFTEPSGALQAQDLAEALRKARAHYWAERFAAAVPFYARYFAHRPEDTTAAFEYGYCLLRSGREPEAWNALRTAVESGRAGIEAETTWIDLSIRLRKPVPALPVAARLRERHPDNQPIARMQARLLEAAGDTKGAVRAWKEIVHRWPDDTDALCPLGRLLSWTGDLEGAEAALRQYRRAHPRDPEGHRRLAEVLGWQWKWPEAVTVLEDALKTHPDDAGLQDLVALEREYFSPRVVGRGFWWDDSQDYVRSGVEAELRAVIAHRVQVRAREEWARFHQDEPGFPVVRRLGTTIGAAWLGPARLKLGGSYTWYDSTETGRSGAFQVEARRMILDKVVGSVAAGRDAVTEKYFAALEGVDVKYIAISAYREEPDLPWSARVGLSRYSDDADRISLDTRLEVPVLEPLSGLWHNWSFWQDQRSYLYFGPKWYSEQELSVVFRPFRPGAFLKLEVQGGVQLALGDRDYGFGDAGDVGVRGEIVLEHHASGAVRFGARALYDRLNTANPYNGYGGEAWLEIVF